MNATITTTMPAWLNDRYGPVVDTRQEMVPTPAPGRGEVLVRVRATALNAADVHLMHGDPLLVRPMFGLTRPKQPIRGNDIAGTIVVVGDGVGAERLGEEVVVELESGGGLAPFAVARVDRLVARPEALAPEVAATLPISGGTATQALDAAGVTAGQRVLIVGASGGVGTFAVQLAVLRGAEVWALCGEPNRALVESLGATRTFDYRTTEVAAIPGPFDAIIDIAGNPPLRVLKRLLTSAGTAVIVGGEGGRVLGPIPRMLHAMVLSIGSRRSIRMLAAVSGLARLESGRTVGKVVVLGPA